MICIIFKLKQPFFSLHQMPLLGVSHVVRKNVLILLQIVITHYKMFVLTEERR